MLNPGSARNSTLLQTAETLDETTHHRESHGQQRRRYHQSREVPHVLPPVHRVEPEPPGLGAEDAALVLRRVLVGKPPSEAEDLLPFPPSLAECAQPVFDARNRFGDAGALAELVAVRPERDGDLGAVAYDAGQLDPDVEGGFLLALGSADLELKRW